MRVPQKLKRAVVRASGDRGYTLTGFVVRALEDAVAGDINVARRLVGRGEINLYVKPNGRKGART